MAKCAQCRQTKAQSDGLCPRCRLRALGLGSRVYRFTEETRQELRAAYAGGKAQRTQGLDRLCARTGWPRHAFKREALRLGIAEHWRKWTPAEEAYVRERAGQISVRQIAKQMGRPVDSVVARIERMQLSRRVAEGYCVMDLCTVFGVRSTTIKSWMRRGLLGKVHEVCGSAGHRVTATNVMRFIRRHPHEYNLNRVDQVWFKSMLFGDLAGAA
jgi:hypothetical protein